MTVGRRVGFVPYHFVSRYYKKTYNGESARIPPWAAIGFHFGSDRVGFVPHLCAKPFLSRYCVENPGPCPIPERPDRPFGPLLSLGSTLEVACLAACYSSWCGGVGKVAASLARLIPGATPTASAGLAPLSPPRSPY